MMYIKFIFFGLALGFTGAAWSVDAVSFLTPTVSGAQSSQTTNSTRLEANNKLYQATYDTTDWSGDLIQHDIFSNGAVSLSSPSVTAAGSVPAFPDRNFITAGDHDSNGDEGMGFNYDNVSADAAYSLVASGATQSASAAFSSVASAAFSSVASSAVSSVFDHLTGETNASLRTREPLADIVNSSPQFAGTVDFGYDIVTGSAASVSGAGASYQPYISTGDAATRHDVIYVGGNGGALHAFDADNDLEEVFAYLPRSLWANVASLSSPSYSHLYYVDATPKVADAYNSAWKTILVGTTGAGGTAVFALDVTDPVTAEADPATLDEFAEQTVLWEIDENSSGYEQLGYTLPQASVVLLEDDTWAAVVANGYGNGETASGAGAKLYLINLFDGSLHQSFSPSVSGTNGLSTPVAVDTNNNARADTIYAGDLQGNLWKFFYDYDAVTPAWQTPQLLFATDDGSGNPQAITAKPQVASHSEGGQLVFFGSGKYFEEDDEAVTGSRNTGLATPPTLNTFYAIRDENDGSTISFGSNLVEQEIIYEGGLLGNTPTPGSASNPLVRVTSDSSVNYNIKNGWYLNFTLVDDRLERIVSEPVLRNGRVIFATLIPEDTDTDTVVSPYEGSGWLMELDAESGSRLSVVPFDLDNDGQFGDDDKTNLDNQNDYDSSGDAVNVSGLKSTGGIISTPAVVAASDKEYKYNSTSEGDVMVTTESGGGGSRSKGRQSWQQLQ